MAVLGFLNGVYEIKNPDWFLTPFGYHSEASLGWNIDDKHKIIFKITALLKLIIGVGVFVFAVFFFVFAVSLLLG